ncbi:helix-turn-helix domain-containing protein [Proteiniphilum sp. UBA7639]|uniref:helix-turn-helix domain-containing protein n=3 Tax=Proteiniphilum TaxID=294702 RepID=UPI0039C95916
MLIYMKLNCLKLTKNQVVHENFETTHCIVFMRKGCGKCESHVTEKYNLMEKQMVLCPISTTFSCKLLRDSEMMFISFFEMTDPSYGLFINSLKNVLNEKHQKCCKPYLLNIKPELNQFLEIINLIHDSKGLTNPEILKRMLNLIFYLYSANYSPEENSLFFSPLICSDYKFKNKVLLHHLKAKNVQELAKLCGYTYNTFNREFMKQFGSSPYKWMINERKKRILQNLEDPTVPLKSIAFTFHFSSPAHFARFCKENFGHSASEIRHKKIEGHCCPAENCRKGIC